MVARRSLNASGVKAHWFNPAGAAVDNGGRISQIAGDLTVDPLSADPGFPGGPARGPLPILALGVLVMIVLLASAAWLPAESLAQTDLGILPGYQSAVGGRVHRDDGQQCPAARCRRANARSRGWPTTMR